MAFSNDITSANAVLVLTVDELYPSGITLQEFSVDNAASMDTIAVAETRMGVDGKMAAGFVPAEYPVTINLEASSSSYESMATIWQTIVKKRTPYTCKLVATIPSINRVFTWKNGVMVEGTPMPGIGRTLNPTQWSFRFQDFEASKSSSSSSTSKSTSASVSVSASASVSASVSASASVSV